MRKVITVNIPEPCHEDWNKMTPKDQGRHCAACNKTVVDFTKQSDEQIIKSLESNGNLCGRFKTQQIDREIVLARKDKNNYLSLAASGMLAFLAFGNQEVYAQGAPKTVKTDTIVRPMLKGKIANSIFNKRIISGIVTYESDSLPLPGASIIVKGTSRGMQTDFDGKFSLEIKDNEVLEISYFGFETKQLTITKTTSENLKINMGSSIMGEIEVVVGGVLSYTHYEGNSEPYISPEEIQEKVEKRKQNHQNWKAKNKAQRVKWKKERLDKKEAIKNEEQERTAFGKFFYGIKSLFSKK